MECWVAPQSATLRMLLMHNGIKHDWSELRMVCDVSRWLAKYPGECVMPILESIPRGHLRVKSAAGLVLAARLLGARLEDPDFWSSRILAGATSHAAMAMGRMFGPVERLPVFSGWRANARWLESYPGASRRWVGAYVRTLLTPEFEDVVAAARGPALMRPFAGPLRGLRLAAKSVRRNGDVKTTKNGLNSTQ